MDIAEILSDVKDEVTEFFERLGYKEVHATNEKDEYK